MIDERVLIDRAKNGEGPAFKELVDRFKVNIYRLAFDMIGNRHDAEDVAQEVFLKAYRSLALFRGDAKFGTWIYRITVNACYDHKSKRSFTAMKPKEELEEDENMKPLYHAEREHDPQVKAESSLMQMHIEQALEKLSPRERSIFVLRHYSDLPLKEIARILRISEGTVKSMLFRALQRLQRELSFYRNDLGLEESP